MEYTYILTTDSDAEMPASWLEELDIKAILMPYTLDGTEYFFDFFREIDDKHFFQQMRDGAKVTTAQRNPEDFKEFWEPWLKEGKDILYVGLSSQLSGTFNSANVAKAELSEVYPDRKILLVDSLSISMPEAMVVRVAAEKRLAGASIEEAAAAAEAVAKRSTALFMVDDLEYLKRGGRGSATAAFFGGMLDIKPVLYISPSGKLEPLLKIKGNKKAMRTMAELCAKCAADPQESHMVICQADCEEQAEVFEGMIREKVAPKSLHTQAVGPVIGSHCGPGTLAICFFAHCDDLADMV